LLSTVIYHMQAPFFKANMFMYLWNCYILMEHLLIVDVEFLHMISILWFHYNWLNNIDMHASLTLYNLHCLSSNPSIFSSTTYIPLKKGMLILFLSVILLKLPDGWAWGTRQSRPKADESLETEHHPLRGQAWWSSYSFGNVQSEPTHVKMR